MHAPTDLIFHSWIWIAEALFGWSDDFAKCHFISKGWQIDCKTIWNIQSEFCGTEMFIIFIWNITKKGEKLICYIFMPVFITISSIKFVNIYFSYLRTLFSSSYLQVDLQWKRPNMSNHCSLCSLQDILIYILFEWGFCMI